MLSVNIILINLNSICFVISRRPAGFPPGWQRLPLVGTVVLGTKQIRLTIKDNVSMRVTWNGRECNYLDIWFLHRTPSCCRHRQLCLGKRTFQQVSGSKRFMCWDLVPAWKPNVYFIRCIFLAEIIKLFQILQISLVKPATFFAFIWTYMSFWVHFYSE